MELAVSLGVNNEFQSLYGEIVDYDVYHLRDKADVVSINDPTYVHLKGHTGIDFVPDTVLDLGANVGIFTRYARSLWPDAFIVSVEPDERNRLVFKEHTSTSRILLLENAIGQGQMYRCPGAVNGAHESYLSEGLGYHDGVFKSWGVQKHEVKPLMLTDLKKHISGKVVCKLDIEGNETVIFNDKESMDLLRTFDYICAELHYFASDGILLKEVRQKTDEALESLRETHHIRYDHVYFYARKK